MKGTAYVRQIHEHDDVVAMVYWLTKAWAEGRGSCDVKKNLWDYAAGLAARQAPEILVKKVKQKPVIRTILDGTFRFGRHKWVRCADCAASWIYGDFASVVHHAETCKTVTRKHAKRFYFIWCSAEVTCAASSKTRAWNAHMRRIHPHLPHPNDVNRPVTYLRLSEDPDSLSEGSREDRGVRKTKGPRMGEQNEHGVGETDKKKEAVPSNTPEMILTKILKKSTNQFSLNNLRDITTDV